MENNDIDREQVFKNNQFERELEEKVKNYYFTLDDSEKSLIKVLKDKTDNKKNLFVCFSLPYMVYYPNASGCFKRKDGMWRVYKFDDDNQPSIYELYDNQIDACKRIAEICNVDINDFIKSRCR